MSAVAEPREVRLKRLAMRSMRRGIKEMDVILSSFATTSLAEMTDAQLDLYDAMLSENDHDLYAWVCGAAEPVAEYKVLVTDIRTHIAQTRVTGVE